MGKNFKFFFKFLVFGNIKRVFWPSFWVILKLSLMHPPLMICSVYISGCIDVNTNVHFLNEASLNVTTFRYRSLGFFLAWNRLFIFRNNNWCCDSHFPRFGKYIFPQLQTCTALVLSGDCTGGSCSSNMVILNNSFEQLFFF